MLLDEAYVEFLAPEHRIDATALVERFPQCRGGAHLLEGLRAGRAADRLRLLRRRVWRARCGRCSCRSASRITGLVAVAASYDAESQLQQRIRMIAAERRLPAAAAARDGRLQHRRARQLRLPAAGAEPWREVFDGTGLQVRHYADGGVRITVGIRAVDRRCCRVGLAQR